MHSTRIETETLRNARDLGGIINKNGKRIKEGKLIRSAQLFDASASDLELLYDKYNVRTIVDFRESREMTEKADPIIRDQRFVDNAIFPDLIVGLTHDEESEKLQKFWELSKVDPQVAKQGMIHCYLKMAEEHSTLMYKKFLNEVINNQQGILWHCAFGKDRCGVGSYLVLKALDVDDDTLLEDYLYSNQCLHPNKEWTESIEGYAHYALQPYLQAYIDHVNQLYGNFDNYLENYLGITKEVKELLAEKYLD
ncbi:MAG: tyrosine-protein phosphatase [Erysipelotrichaceae bacterium]